MCIRFRRTTETTHQIDNCTKGYTFPFKTFLLHTFADLTSSFLLKFVDLTSWNDQVALLFYFLCSIIFARTKEYWSVFLTEIRVSLLCFYFVWLENQEDMVKYFIVFYMFLLLFKNKEVRKLRRAVESWYGRCSSNSNGLTYDKWNKSLICL